MPKKERQRPVHLPSQEELDNCKTIQDKFLLKPPDFFYELNERGMSKAFSEIMHPILVFNAGRNRWFFYDGKRWLEDSCGVFAAQKMKEFSFELLKYATVIAENPEDEFLRFVQKLGSASKRKILLTDAQSNNVIFDADFDKNPLLLNVQNGTIELNTGCLFNHNPFDYITKIANVEYNAQAPDSLINDFMLQVFEGDQEITNYVYRALGYSASGLCNEETMFIFYGATTRNGKSTLLNLFAYMLGDYSVNVDISSFAKRTKMNGSYASSDIARLKGSRFAVASEPPPDLVLDESRIKSITGQDSITARFLHQNDIQFVPTFKIFIGANCLPVLDDTIIESGRIRVIPFNHHFSANEQDKNLKEKLRNPLVLSALLNCCLRGFTEYRNNGSLNEPRAILEETANYKSPGKLFKYFLDSELVPAENAYISLAQFYPLYESWCNNNGLVLLSRSKVSNIMRRIGRYRSTATIDGKTVRNILTGYALPEKQYNG